MNRSSLADQRRRTTPQHRQTVTRRIIKKIHLLALVLGIMSILLSVVFLLMALLKQEPLYSTTWLLSAIYFGGALFFLAVRKGTGKKRTDKRAKRRKAKDRSKDGMALILVLVVLGLLVALMIHSLHLARHSEQTAHRVHQQARFRVALNDEAFYRLRELANDEDPAVDHLKKDWAKVKETERPDGIVTVSRIIDLNRYVDLNNLMPGEEFTEENRTERILIEAMTEAGDFTPIERIEPVRAWISPDEEGLYNTAHYMEKDPPYAPPNTWLHTWNELSLIEGFDAEYFERRPMYSVGRPFTADFIDVVTLIPGPRERPTKININTAPLPVLTSLFGVERESLARYIYLSREERPFRSVEALIGQVDPLIMRELGSFMDVQSSHFLLEVRAVERDEVALLRVVAARSEGNRINILQWVQ